MRKRAFGASEWGLGARCNFCLFVDDLCLESEERRDQPVVKLLWKPWGPLAPEERKYSMLSILTSRMGRLSAIRRMWGGCM